MSGERRLNTEESTSFATDLERRAQRIVRAHRTPSGEPGVAHVVVQEIALILDQIEGHRALDQRLKHELLEAECSIGTELIQMEQRTPRYSPYRFPEREKFQRQLRRVGEERRRLALTYEQLIQRLHDRLVGLVARHELLAAYENGR